MHTKEKLFRILCKQKQGKCECGNANYLFFEFAHYNRLTKYRTRNGKIIGFNRLHLKQMKNELGKGRFLCKLCHRMETTKEYENTSLDALERHANLAKTAELGSKICTGYFHSGTALSPREFYNNHSRCKNCYYYDIYRRVRNKRDYINNIKIELGMCQFCSLPVRDNYTYFEFDHIDPTNKFKKVSELHKYKTSTIDIEIKKCQLLCADCHFKKTHPHFCGLS